MLLLSHHEVGLVKRVVLVVGLLHATDWSEVDVVDLRVRNLVELLLAGVLNQVYLLLQLVIACLCWLLSGR